MEDSEDTTGLDKEVANYLLIGLGESYMSASERIARKVMIELINVERADFLLLRDDEVRDWWSSINAGILRKIQLHKEKVRLYEIKMQAYNKLSAAERKTLGIRKPVQPKGKL